MAGFATPNESPQHLEARLQLGSACKKGDLQAVLQLLDGGEIALDQERYDGCLCATADSAHPRSAGWPSNGAYSYQGYVDTARMLLDRGANPNCVNPYMLPYRYAPLVSACMWAHLDLARLLIARGASVNYAPKRSSAWDDLPGPGPALLEVCSTRSQSSADKCVDLARLLLDHGADVHLTSYRNQTPLHQACHALALHSTAWVGRKVALARLLLEHGAGSDLYRKDRDGSTPLTPASGHPGGPDWAQHPRMKALLRKHFAITIRKYVIGPPAEHPSRRIEHQAPLIASFLI